MNPRDLVRQLLLTLGYSITEAKDVKDFERFIKKFRFTVMEFHSLDMIFSK